MEERHAGRAPQDVLGGQYSLPFTMAVALTRDMANPLVYNDEAVRDPVVRELAQRIELQPLEDALHEGPGVWPAKVQLDCAGQRHTLHTRPHKGSPRNPFTWEEACEKFRRYTASILSAQQATTIIDAVGAWSRWPTWPTSPGSWPGPETSEGDVYADTLTEVDRRKPAQHRPHVIPQDRLSAGWGQRPSSHGSWARKNSRRVRPAYMAEMRLNRVSKLVRRPSGRPPSRSAPRRSRRSPCGRARTVSRQSRAPAGYRGRPRTGPRGRGIHRRPCTWPGRRRPPRRSRSRLAAPPPPPPGATPRSSGRPGSRSAGQAAHGWRGSGASRRRGRRCPGIPRSAVDSCRPAPCRH